MKTRNMTTNHMSGKTSLPNLTTLLSAAAALLAVLVASSLLTSCSEFDNDYSEGELAFVQGFHEQFGEIDPNQDWNAAAQGTVTVTTATSSTIKVYSENMGTYKLLCTYEYVSGTKTLTFDAPKDITTIIVSDGETALRTMVGGRVSMAEGTSSASATANVVSEAPTRSHDGHVDVNGNEWYKEWVRPVNITANERQKVIEAFSKPIHYSNTTPAPWPNYWVQQVYKGVATYTDEAGNSGILGSGHMNKLIALSGDGYIHVNNFNDGNNTTTYADDVTGEKFIGTTLMFDMPTTISDDLSTKQFGYHNSSGSQDRFEYIILEVDGGYYVGFDFCCENAGVDKNMTVERDWIYNDWIVKISPALMCKIDPTVLDDADEQSWILACEDFGGDGTDIDYNDVVFEVTRLTATRASIKPLAAGGTLASYIFFGDQCLGEIHQLFGAGVQNSGEYTPINVSNRITDEASAVEFAVPSNWQLAYNHTTAGNMGGFSIKVLDKGVRANAVPSSGKLTTVPAPSLGGAPYIICIPSSYVFLNDPTTGQKTTYTWAWPQEKCNIERVYSQFRGWVNNPSVNTTWYEYPLTRTMLCQSVMTAIKKAMTTAENTACGTTTSVKLNLPDYFATTIQPSNLTAIQQSVDVEQGGTVNLRDYISTSSNGTIRYYQPTGDSEINNVNGTYEDGNMRVSYNRKAHVVKITQEATASYDKGEVEITVNVLADANPRLNQWTVGSQGGNTSGKSKEQTLSAGTPLSFSVDRDGSGELTVSISNGDGANATVTQNGNLFTVNTGTEPGTAVVRVTLAKDLTNFYFGGEVTVTLNITEADQAEEQSQQQEQQQQEEQQSQEDEQTSSDDVSWQDVTSYLSSWALPASLFAGATKFVKVKGLAQSGLESWYSPQVCLYYEQPRWTKLIDYETINTGHSKEWTITGADHLSALKTYGAKLMGNNMGNITKFWIAVE